MQGINDKVIVKREWFIKSKQGKVEDYYETSGKSQVIGQGQFGSVTKVKLKGTNQFRALKTIPKSRVRNPELFQNEINIMKQLDHPNVIKLYETFEDSRNVYLIMELCDGGELFDSIINKGKYSESEARSAFKDIAQAVSYCHSHKICHRDLKPENFLLLNNTPDSPIKVIDFGLSCLYVEINKDGTEKILDLTLRAGSSYYMSPEVLKGHYTYLCDVWSLGVILFILLSGVPPFYGSTDKQIFGMIEKGKFSFEIPQFQGVSDAAKDLITKCLVPEGQRLTAQQVLEHPWMNIETPKLKSELSFASLKNFTQHQKLKKVALTYIASQLSEKEIGELGKLFKSLDKNNDGSLSVQEIQQGLKELDAKSAQELAKIIQSIDTDGSGTIDYTEFIAASLDASVFLKQDHLFNTFKMLDVDGSGKISRDEVKKALCNDNMYKNYDESYWDNIIKEVDKNNDGEIDYNEFVEMMSKQK